MKLDLIRKEDFLDVLGNVFPTGRNRIYPCKNRYHIMIMTAEQLLLGDVSNNKIWGVNTQMKFHKEK
jgi:hypothetical protein